MKGWVYVIHATGGRMHSMYKIGQTIHLYQRMNNLAKEYDCQMTIMGTIYTQDHEQLELDLHAQYKFKRLSVTEWFRLDEQELDQLRQLFNTDHSGLVFGKVKPATQATIVGPNWIIQDSRLGYNFERKVWAAVHNDGDENVANVMRY